MQPFGGSGTYTFQSTPPRGGRRSRTGQPLPARCFNPRPRAGGDVLVSASGSKVQVSIHAPARGATVRTACANATMTRFNPRPRAGGDFRPGISRTLPPGFNPRPRAGGDVEVDTVRGRYYVSIHAPARGATIRGVIEVTVNYVSIHAPARGATHGSRHRRLSHRFQSTPPRGGRPRSK